MLKVGRKRKRKERKEDKKHTNSIAAGFELALLGQLLASRD